MPLNFDSNDTDFLAYVKIVFSGETVRWGREERTLDDGTPVEAKLVSMTRLRRSTGSLLDPRVEYPSVSLQIDNKPEQDGTRVQDLVELYEFANAAATIHVGQGVAAASFEELFTGFVKFPGGVSFNDEFLTIFLSDARAKDALYLPTVRYTTGTFPNMETGKINYYRPIPIGDWRSTAEGGLSVPCVQIDSTVGAGGQFEIAGIPLKQLEDVKKNGVSAAYSAVDVDNKRFTLDVGYAPGTDVITAHILGATDDNTVSGTAAEMAPDIFEYVYEHHLSVASANINDTALSDWLANLDASRDKMRRWIGGAAQIHSDDLIAQLMTEGFADLGIEAGKYYPRYRIVSTGASLPQVMEEDIKQAGDNQGRIFEVETEPEDIYANKVVADYQYDPVSALFKAESTQSDAAAIAAKGQTVQRNMEFHWLYQLTGAGDRTAREIYVFSGNPELVRMEVGPMGTVLEPSEQLRIVYNKFTADGTGLGVPFQVRDHEADFLQMIAVILAWNILRLGTGTWTEDAAVTWNTATVAQRREKGFWTDDLGYADDTVPLDAASQIYRFL